MGREISAVVFDWAGTAIDFGSLVPLRSLREAMAEFQLDVMLETLRRPMGTSKADHIRSVLSEPAVSSQWLRRTGRNWQESDVEAILKALETAVRRAAAVSCRPVPGLDSALSYLRRRGILCGSTTGYTRWIMEAIMPAAERQGFAPDCVVCSDEVKAGRPDPWMMYKNAEILGVSDMSRLVKVGDTPVDMEEGINSGSWAVGVMDSSSLMSLTLKEFEALTPRERRARRKEVKETLFKAGAHYVISGPAELPRIIEDIEVRLELSADAWHRLSALGEERLVPVGT